MANVFRKTYTKPLPDGAEMFTRKGQRYARWKDAKGKTQTAKVTIPEKGEHAGTPRIVKKAATFTAKYRDGQNIICEVATGCRDETAARQVLADLVKRAEQVRSGILTSDEDTMSRHQQATIGEHIVAYIVHLKAKGVTASRIKTTESRMNRVFGDCGMTRLSDLSSEKLENWLGARAEEKMSAAARNGYRSACVAFGNWLAGKRGKVTVANQKRLPTNPFDGVHKANEKADPKRQRRALSEDELRRLLGATRRRPLLEAKTVRRGKNAGKPVAEVKPETRRRLERLGHERALLYKTLLLRLLADALKIGESPTAKELLEKARQEEPRMFDAWSAKGAANALRRYQIVTRKSHGRRCYGHVRIEQLQTVQASYSMDLGLTDAEGADDAG